MSEGWPLDRVAKRPDAVLLCRDDHLLPALGTARCTERLGITPDEIDGGHCPALSRPKELADRLESYTAP